MLIFVNIFAPGNQNEITMAIGYGLSGKIRGKLGSSVYRIQSGKQVISEYNPEKTGTKSQGQIEMRAKMAMANNVSRCFPSDLLVGLSRSRATARQTLVGSIVKDATIVPDTNTQIWAQFNANKLSLSKGVSIPTMDETVRMATGTRGIVSVSMLLPPNTKVTHVLFVLLPKVVITGEFKQAVGKVSEFRGHSEPAYADINVSEVETYPTTVYHAYAIPIIPNDLGRRVEYSESLSVDAEALFTTIAYLYNTRQVNFGQTIYLGNVVSEN